MPWLSALMLCLLCGNMFCIRLWDSRLLQAFGSNSDTDIPTQQQQSNRQLKAFVDNLNQKLKHQRESKASSDCQEAIIPEQGCAAYSGYGNGIPAVSKDSLDSLNALFDDDSYKPLNSQSGKLPHNLDEVAGNNADLKHLIPELPIAHYNEFYEDLIGDIKEHDVKRNKHLKPAVNCDCKIKYELLDLGAEYFPRFLLNAVCQTENAANEYEMIRCAQGSYCRKLEYKVKVLTYRIEQLPNDNTFLWLPDDLRHFWKFETKTVAAGCFCGA